MIGNDDIEVLIDEPITAAELFGEDEEEPMIPPLSPDPNLDEDGDGNTAPADGDAADGVQPKKVRRVNRLPNLNEKWITDPTKEGMHAVNKYFEKVKLKRGKGNELKNIKSILKRYEYWAQQCYPKLCFKDFVEKVETLSAKKLVKNALQEIRNNRALNDLIIDDAQDGNGAQDGDVANTSVDDHVNPFMSTPQPIISPPTFTSFSTPQPVASSNDTITNDMKEMIRRKREEAIAKRKRKLEESLNKSDMSMSQASESEHVITEEKDDDTSSLQQAHDSSCMSVSDTNEELQYSTPVNPFMDSNQESVSQSEMEVGDDLKEIIRRKKEEAIAKRKSKLIESQNTPNVTITPTNEKEDINSCSDMSQESSLKQPSVDSLHSQDSCMSTSDTNVKNMCENNHQSTDSYMSVTTETNEGKTQELQSLDSQMSLEINEQTIHGSPVDQPLTCIHDPDSQSDTGKDNSKELENDLHVSTSQVDDILIRENGKKSSVLDEMNEEKPSSSVVEKENMEIDESDG